MSPSLVYEPRGFRQTTAMTSRANMLDTARTILIGEVALGLWVMAAPAGAQTARVDMQGSVAPRCSALSLQAIDLQRESSDLRDFSRRLTVRCSGTSPALSVRTQALTMPGVTLTAFGAAGQMGTATEAGQIVPADLGERLAAGEGNLLVRIPAAQLGSATAGALEIIVSPAP